MNRLLQSWFPLVAIIFAGIAYVWPQLFISQKQYVGPLLGVVMFFMGITLSWDDFRRALLNIRVTAFGVLLQYSLMPFLAWGIATVLGLPLSFLIGMLLVGACPGGTASNVICYLSGANVALSITLTAISTLAAVVLTPLLTYLYIGQAVEVPIEQMLVSVAKIVILPVLLGVALHRFFSSAAKAIAPSLSILAICFIIAIIIATNAYQLHAISALLVLAVCIHNLLGLVLGYLIPLALKMDQRTCRTLAIEVGMQNSGLGGVLALQHFSALSAVPAAIFSVFHNISGGALARYWSRKR